MYYTRQDHEASITIRPARANDAEALRRLITEPDLREQLARAGLARAATFTWERAARETLAVLEAAAFSPVRSLVVSAWTRRSISRRLLGSCVSGS